MIRFHILSIFPEMFYGVFQESILKRAQKNGLIEINLVNIRDYATDKHASTDDYPFGGGPGMVMKIEPIFRAITAISTQAQTSPHRIFMSPRGQVFDQQKAIELAEKRDILLLCGHYEGIDERIKELLIDEELSLGDFVLTGGELPAMVVVDAVSRMIPGVLGDENSVQDDSFFQGILGYPQYTRPREFAQQPVPEVLLSGNHALIAQWRRKKALQMTYLYRPDLLQGLELTQADQKLLKEIISELQTDKQDVSITKTDSQI